MDDEHRAHFERVDRKADRVLMAHHRRVEEIIEHYLRDCPEEMQANYRRECARFEAKMKRIEEEY